MNALLSIKKVSLLLGIVLFWAFTPARKYPGEELPIGKHAPLSDKAVKDVSGQALTLDNVKQRNGLLVIFSCNTCPWVARWEDRYNPIAKLAKENGIGMIALNSNASYRDRGDSYKYMQRRSRQSNYQFYYALDENSELAEAFGATHTPHVFLFDKDMKLVYRGAIDDNAYSATEVDRHFLQDAISALIAGKEISPNTTKSLGCTIKWPS